MNNTMISPSELQAYQQANSDPSISVEALHVGGNVQRNIVAGNRNVIGDKNVIYEVNTLHSNGIT